MSITSIERWQGLYGTAAEWAAANPILAINEEGYETDTKKSKKGDGATAWNSLTYDRVIGALTATTGAFSEIITASKGVKFAATMVPSADPNTLDDYREFTWTATATGMTTSPTGTISVVRSGGGVTMQFAEIGGTSNATTFTLTGMPTPGRPTANRTMLVRIANNGVIDTGLAEISSSGEISFYPAVTGGVFTASGLKKIYALSVSYII